MAHVTMLQHTLIQMALTAYAIGSPFFFLWFHRCVMKEAWDGDFADRVVLRLFILSQLLCVYLGWIFEQCGQCNGKW